MFKVHFDKKFTGETVIYLVEYSPGDRQRTRYEISIKPMGNAQAGIILEPSFVVDERFEGLIPALAEGLQEAGLVPSNATATELAATKRHLEDMRSLVFEAPKPHVQEIFPTGRPGS